MSGLSKSEKNNIRAIITRLSKQESAEFFLYPVDSKAYPEYYEVIDKPMDLSTVRQNLNNYASIEEALTDIRLIWDNCKEFNSDESDIYVTANTFAQLTEELVEELLGKEYVLKKRKRKKSLKEEAPIDPIPELPTKKSKTKSNIIYGLNLSKISLSKKAIRKIITELKKNPDMELFLFPVDDRAAPGYYDIITNPMDLSKIELNLKNDVYNENIANFITDINQIWENCYLYNLPKSDICLQAKKLSAEFNELVLKYNEYDESLDVKDLKTSNQMSSSNDAIILTVKKRKAEVSDIDTQIEKNVEKKVEKKDKTLIKFESLLNDLMNDPRSLPFRLPVNPDEAPGYFQIIKNPMDLSTISNYLETDIERYSNKINFLSDLLLIYSNCQLYNSDESKIYEWAEDLKKMTKTKFMKLFPDVSKEDIQLLEKERAEQIDSQIEEPVDAFTEIKPKKKSGRPSTKDHKVNKANDVDKNEIVEQDKEVNEEEELFLKYKSIEEIETMISILQSEIGLRTTTVKFKSREIANQLLVGTQLPYIIVPGLYEVYSFGSIHNGSGYHDQNYIYPVAYKCTRLIYVYIVPQNETIDDIKKYNYVPLAVTSTIASSVGNKHSPKFILTIDNGTVISDGNTFHDAWTNLFKQSVLLSSIRMAASRMKRCISLLNRLSTLPEASIYLEQEPLENDNYYDTIKAPMWLRLIHERLHNGYYDNEFDFAWDFRLIIRNGLNYYSKDIDEYNKTIELSHRFEFLFCKWVLHPQDRSVNDLANGPWDNWYHLLYYEPSREQDKSLFMVCPSCKNRFNPEMIVEKPQGELDDEITPSKTKLSTHCKRCTDALNEEVPNFETSASQTVNRYNPSYTREEHNMPSFVPLPDFAGIGWCQALRHRRGGLKQVYLSPFGFILYSRDTALDHSKFEELIDQKLLQFRQEEFQKSNATDQTSKFYQRRDMGIHLLPKTMHLSYQGYINHSENQVNTDKDPYRINNGKLINCEILEGHRLALYGYGNELDIYNKLTTNREDLPISELNGSNIYTVSNDLIELSSSTIPSTGYYGFDIPEIKVRIEGLPASELCTQYNQYVREYARQKLLTELLQQKNISLVQGKSQIAIMAILQEERYIYEKQRLWPNTGFSYIDYSKNLNEIRNSFNSLFPSNMNVQNGEVLLCLWDILDGISMITDEFTFTLNEVLECIQVSSNKPVDIHYVVFNEICCLLTKFLLSNVRYVINTNDEFVWQNILSLNPINIITWPYILHNYMISKCSNWTSVDIINILTKPILDKYIIQLDIVCLIDHSVYMYVLRKLYSLNKNDNESQVNSEISIKCVESFQLIQSNILEKKYDNEIDLSNELIQVFSDILDVYNDETNSLAYQLIIELLLYCQKLFTKLNINNDNSNLSNKYISNYMKIELECMKYFHQDMIDIGLNLTSIVLQYNHSNVNKTTYNTIYTSSNTYSNKTNNPSIDIPYYIYINQFNHLEMILSLLLKKDIDQWNENEKISLIHVLIFCVTNSLLYNNKQIENKNEIKKSLTSLNDLSMNQISNYTASHNVNLQYIPKREVTDSFVCCYSNCDEKNLSNNGSRDIKWVYVPNTCLNPIVSIPLSSFIYKNIIPKFNDIYINDNVIDKKYNNHYISQDSSVLRILTAREIANEEKVKFESKFPEYYSILKQSLNDFMNSVTTNTQITKLIETICPNILRGAPLGYDRYGSTYYLLNAQETMTLKTLGSYSIDLATESNNNISVDPAVLIRDPTGWWGYHNGRQLDKLLDRFSDDIENELILKQNIILRLLRTRGKLYLSTLRLKLHQKEWLTQRIVIEKKFHNYNNKLFQLTDEKEKMKELEFYYTRLLELRMYIHYSMIYKNDYEIDRNSNVRYSRENYLKIQKRVKDTLIDDTYDLHPIKGWLRFDPLSSLRELISNTLATKIHSDVNYILELRNCRIRSAFHKQLLEITSSKREALNTISEINDNVKTETNNNEIIVKDINDKTNENEIVNNIESTENKIIVSNESNQVDSNESKIDSKIETNSSIKEVSYDNKQLTISSSQSLLNNIDPSTYSQFITGHTKAIEQLHPITGEVLRIYPSGRIAAAFMNVSQGGISQCCNNKQMEAFGFRWRFYEGPTIDWSAVENTFKSLEELQIIQGIKKKSLPTIQTAGTITKSTIPTNNISNALINKPVIQQQLIPQPVILKPNIILSNVIVTPTLLKLKAELFSIFLALPEKSLKWPELDNIDISEEIEKEKEININVVIDEKAIRKRKRREKRKIANEKVFNGIQNAKTPQELLDILLLIESVIPIIWLLDYNKDHLPIIANTCSEVAIRLYTLDRFIRYEEINGVETIYTKYLYRPRVHYTLRCMLQCNCKGILNHQGKCQNSIDLISRFNEVDLPSINIPSYVSLVQNNTTMNRPIVNNIQKPLVNTNTNTFRPSNLPMNNPNNNYNININNYNQLAALSSSLKPTNIIPIKKINNIDDDDDDDSERLNTIVKKKKDKILIDIEFVQPYVPPLSKITMIEWV